MQKYNYKRNFKTYIRSGGLFICLLLILSNKIINTKRIYGGYKEAKAAYGQEQYLTAHSLYKDLYKQTKFNYFSKEIINTLKTEEMTFIEESIAFLEEKKAAFELEFESREILDMLETYDLYRGKSNEINQESNKNNISTYNTLVDQYNLEALFSNGFQEVWKEFKESIDQNIESKDFEEEQDFTLYSLVLKKIIGDSEEINKMIGTEKYRYYTAKMEWIINMDDLDKLLSEASQMIHDYGNLEEAQWITDKVTDVTIQKMKASIEDENYVRFKSYGSWYFNYIGKLPVDLSDERQVRQLVNDQLTSDVKRLEAYMSKNKFEEAIFLYDSINEYMEITDGTDIDIDQLRIDIDDLWIKYDPIRMFGDLQLTEISKGQSKWGRETYVLATDENEKTLYWGEVNAQKETKQLWASISLDSVQDIYISNEFSVHGNPVIILEGYNESGEKTHSGYEVFEEDIEQILYIETDYLESRAQGEVIIARDSYGVGLTYYEYDGYEYIRKFALADVEIYNGDYYGNYLSGVQDVYSYYEINYISFSTAITKGDNDSSSLDGTLHVKYVDPYGVVKWHSGSYNDYTWSVPINTMGTQEITRGYGSESYGSYGLGWYTIEVWWNNMKITETYFEVIE